VSTGRLALPGRGPVEPAVTGGSDHSDQRDLSRIGRVDKWSQAWLEHAGHYTERVANASSPVDEQGCQRELVFCLLGGHGVKYELARSATEILVARGVLGECVRSGDRLQRWLQDLLGRPWYEPARVDGRGCRYRYPKRKALLLRQADDWLREHVSDGLLNHLATIEDEHERRAWLCECPGVGPKTASWLLRNIGLGDRLAILDVHVLRALEATGRAGEWQLSRHYVQLESAFLQWSASLDAVPAAFDLFLWEYQRGDV
jgi:N-glycosylase/DNA lyase